MCWISLHGRQHGGDPNNIYFFGHSAGAQIVALFLFATAKLLQQVDTPNPSYLPLLYHAELVDHVLHQKWKLNQIQGFIGVSGVYHIMDHYHFEAGRGLEEVSAMKPTMGGFPHFRLCSPYSHAIEYSDHGLMHLSILLVHGDHDKTVPLSSSQKFISALRKFQVVKNARLEVIQDCGHTDMCLPAIGQHHKFLHLVNIVKSFVRQCSQTIK